MISGLVFGGGGERETANFVDIKNIARVIGCLKRVEANTNKTYNIVEYYIGTIIVLRN